MNSKLLRRPSAAAFVIIGLDMLMLLICMILTMLENEVDVNYESDSNMKIGVRS